METFIGIDNGPTGSIGIINKDLTIVEFIKTPSFTEQSYTKKIQQVSRINYVEFKKIISNHKEPYALLERPMINNRRFHQSLSAIRALEVMLVCLEELNIPFSYIDSRSWQNELLPNVPRIDDKGIKIPSVRRSALLKQESRKVAKILYPDISVVNFKDADGLMIAEYAKKHDYGC